MLVESVRIALLPRRARVLLVELIGGGLRNLGAEPLPIYHILIS